MGVREARKLTPCPATVIISILDQFEEHAWPEQLHEFGDHLVLDFVDTFEKPGEREWPDQLTEEDTSPRAPGMTTERLSWRTHKRSLRFWPRTMPLPNPPSWLCAATVVLADRLPWRSG